MASEPTSGLMVDSFKAIGFRTRCMEKGNTNGKMGGAMLDNTSTIKSMALGPTPGLMDEST